LPYYPQLYAFHNSLTIFYNRKKDDGTVEKISHHGFVKIWDVEHCPVELRPELFKPAGELLIDVTNAAAEVSKVDLKKQPWLNAEGCLRNK
jgi:hypothetical protein